MERWAETSFLGRYRFKISGEIEGKTVVMAEECGAGRRPEPSSSRVAYSWGVLDILAQAEISIYDQILDSGVQISNPSIAKQCT